MSGIGPAHHEQPAFETGEQRTPGNILHRLAGAGTVVEGDDVHSQIVDLSGNALAGGNDAVFEFTVNVNGPSVMTTDLVGEEAFHALTLRRRVSPIPPPEQGRAASGDDDRFPL